MCLFSEPDHLFSWLWFCINWNHYGDISTALFLIARLAEIVCVSLQIRIFCLIFLQNVIGIWRCLHRACVFAIFTQSMGAPIFSLQIPSLVFSDFYYFYFLDWIYSKALFSGYYRCNCFPDFFFSMFITGV